MKTEGGSCWVKYTTVDQAGHGAVIVFYLNPSTGRAQLAAPDEDARPLSPSRPFDPGLFVPTEDEAKAMAEEKKDADLVDKKETLRTSSFEFRLR